MRNAPPLTASLEMIRLLRIVTWAADRGPPESSQRQLGRKGRTHVRQDPDTSHASGYTEKRPPQRRSQGHHPARLRPLLRHGQSRLTLLGHPTMICKHWRYWILRTPSHNHCDAIANRHRVTRGPVVVYISGGVPDDT